MTFELHLKGQVRIWPEGTIVRRFQDGSQREEAESMPPIVKSWRDAGNTPYRQNHREEAKL
jgi:hypothetical protein